MLAATYSLPTAAGTAQTTFLPTHHHHRPTAFLPATAATTAAILPSVHHVQTGSGLPMAIAPTLFQPTTTRPLDFIQQRSPLSSPPSVIDHSKRRSLSPAATPPSSSKPPSNGGHTSFSIESILGKKDSSTNNDTKKTTATTLIQQQPSHPSLTRTTANGFFYIYTPSPAGAVPQQPTAPSFPFASPVTVRQPYEHHHELQRSPLGPMVLGPAPGK